MSHAPPVYEEGMTGSRPNERPTTTTTVPWHSRTLSPFTLYGELSVACTPEEFALLRSRLQQEWSFDGGFVSKLITVLLDSQLMRHSPYSSWVLLRKFCTIRRQFGTLTTTSVNAAILAITTDSIFKIDSSAYIAVATSSSACGLGIVCDVWFLLRYNWVDLQTFIVRTLLTSTSSHVDIAVHSIVLVTYMVHTSPSPCHHACPLSAWWYLPSRSCPSLGVSHSTRRP